MGTAASLLESRASEFFTLDTQSRCSFSDRNELSLAGGFALAGSSPGRPTGIRPQRRESGGRTPSARHARRRSPYIIPMRRTLQSQ